MSLLIKNPEVTPPAVANGQQVSIVFSARSFSGPQTMTASYSILDTPKARLVGNNPETFDIVKKARDCPNTLTLQLQGNVPPGLYFIVIMAEDSVGDKDADVAPLTIL